MRVTVDENLCESNGMCEDLAPDVFEIRDDDLLYVIEAEPPAALHAAVEEAAVRCPKQAILLER